MRMGWKQYEVCGWGRGRGIDSGNGVGTVTKFWGWSEDGKKIAYRVILKCLYLSIKANYATSKETRDNDHIQANVTGLKLVTQSFHQLLLQSFPQRPQDVQY